MPDGTRRIVVLGATGNIGTATTRRLLTDGHEVVGVARRVPADDRSGVTWQARDLTRDDLAPVLEGADAVIHLAWLIQPSRDLAAQWAVNVDAFDRVLDAVGRVQVPRLVVASSVGAYSPRLDHHPVDESWPTHGVANSSYSRQKAYMERMMDAFEAAGTGTRVVRLRPGLVFQLDAASEQRRLFGGALVPSALLRPGRLPVLPHLDDVAFQAVHADDLADAIGRIVTTDVDGAFNLAAPDVLGTDDVAELLGARPVPVPFRLARAAADVSWRLRLHPLSPGWLDLARRSPVLDPGRAVRDLGWEPSHTGRQALAAALTGIAAGTGAPTPTLRPDRDDRAPLQELRTGQGTVDSHETPAPRRATPED